MKLSFLTGKCPLPSQGSPNLITTPPTAVLHALGDLARAGPRCGKYISSLPNNVCIYRMYYIYIYIHNYIHIESYRQYTCTNGSNGIAISKRTKTSLLQDNDLFFRGVNIYLLKQHLAAKGCPQKIWWMETPIRP